MANTTISVENPNQGSLHVKLSEISNSLADISQTLSLYPAIKKGIEEPDYTNKFKKINSRIKQLINQIEFLNTKVITQEEFDEIYLKIQNFKSKLMSSLDDSIIKNKIKSLFPSLNNYYTKSEVNTIINEHQPNLEDYYTRVQSYNLFKDNISTKYTEQIITRYLDNLLKSYVNQQVQEELTYTSVPEHYIRTYEETSSEFHEVTTSSKSNYNIRIYSVIEGHQYDIKYRYTGFYQENPKNFEIARFGIYSNESWTDSGVAIENVLGSVNQEGTVTITIPVGITQLAISEMYPNSNRIHVTEHSEPSELINFINHISSQIVDTTNFPRLAICKSGNYICVTGINSLGNEDNVMFIFSHNVGGNNTFSLTHVYVESDKGSSISTNTLSKKYMYNTSLIDGQTGSDMIGPINIQYDKGTEGHPTFFIGGTHSYNGGDLKTSITDDSKLKFYIDGELFNLDQLYSYLGETIKYGQTFKCIVENTLKSPLSDDISKSGNDWIIDQNAVFETLGTETQTWEIAGNQAKIHVKLEFEKDAYIEKYYGMQTYTKPKFNSDLQIIKTVNGKFDIPKYTNKQYDDVIKQEYPNCNEFIIKHTSSGWCESLRIDPSVGIGDHHLLEDNKNILQDDGASKYYHWLISNTQVQDGDMLEWEGVYTFFKDYDTIIVPE